MYSAATGKFSKFYTKRVTDTRKIKFYSRQLCQTLQFSTLSKTVAIEYSSKTKKLDAFQIVSKQFFSEQFSQTPHQSACLQIVPIEYSSMLEAAHILDIMSLNFNLNILLSHRTMNYSRKVPIIQKLPTTPKHPAHRTRHPLHHQNTMLQYQINLLHHRTPLLHHQIFRKPYTSYKSFPPPQNNHPHRRTTYLTTKAHCYTGRPPCCFIRTPCCNIGSPCCPTKSSSCTVRSLCYTASPSIAHMRHLTAYPSHPSLQTRHFCNEAKISISQGQ